jgi:L-amino acid N-acyltransferase YncA
MPEHLIRPMRPDDWPEVKAIYEAGIATGNATFETEAPSWERWDSSHLPDHRLVAEHDGRVVGWAALSPVSNRPVYRGVAEHSVYIAPETRGQGVGRSVLEALIESAEAAGFWTVQTGIFPENSASLALHAACGFRVVGTRERIGQLDGRWRDVAFLERRSREQ